MPPVPLSHEPPSDLRGACDDLAAAAAETALIGPWASGGMRVLARRGILARFVPADCGGTAAPEPEIVETLAAVAT